jgi:DNA (cytosine-5)-methyltransferase 1
MYAKLYKFEKVTSLIKEMKESTGGEYPKIAIWENVTGAMSSNGGDDFETVIKEMAGLGSYHLEWSVLDAQYFGVPQKRRRVFVIAILDPAIARRSPQQILPVEKSSKGNFKKSIKQEHEDPKELASCLRSGGEGGVPSSRGENLVVDHKGVRRFTPIECERLMGWPTNHTLYRADGKTNSDNTRYKMCGNGVVSPVIKWVVDQIKKI